MSASNQQISGTLSVILLCYYSKDRLQTAFDKLSGLFEKERIPFELVIVDDGSKDESFSIAEELERKDERVKAFKLSRNYTSHYSAFAGLSVCTGDCAVLIPDDEQLPYNDVVAMYRLWQQGEKIIVPHREMRDEPWLKRNLSAAFYGIMNRLSEIKFPPGGADSFFIDREVINVLNEKIHPIRTTTISEILRLGYSPWFYPYNRPFGTNSKSRWSFKKKYLLAKDFFFSSSTYPIKFITNIGLVFSILSFLIMGVYLYAKLFGNPSFWHLDQVPGWVSIIVFISFFSGLTLLSLGVIAEYIWRIYEEVKARPGYLIKNKSNNV